MTDKLSREIEARDFLKKYIPWISKSDLKFLTTYLRHLPRSYLSPEKIIKVLEVSHESKTWRTI